MAVLAVQNKAIAKGKPHMEIDFGEAYGIAEAIGQVMRHFTVLPSDISPRTRDFYLLIWAILALEFGHMMRPAVAQWFGSRAGNTMEAQVAAMGRQSTATVVPWPGVVPPPPPPPV